MRCRVVLFVMALGFWPVFSSGCAGRNQPVTKSDIEPVVASPASIPAEYQALLSKLEPFFERMGDPEPGDWLGSFDEDGQTFARYIVASPTLPTKKRNRIYIRPIGRFSRADLKMVEESGRFLQAFFGLETIVMPAEPFPEPMRVADWRTHPIFKVRQIRTGFVLDDLLAPSLPADAAALICFTNEDLYPGDNFNFVFGQASLRKRVGVWSFNRLRQDVSPKEFKKRVLKLAIHETGHMFSIEHCTAYSCAMNGSNHLQESDRRPLDFCPEDTAKLLWFSKRDAAQRFTDLSGLLNQIGLFEDSKDLHKKSEALR